MKLLERILSDHLGPRVLIEANAGTGKTYTIQGLFIRHLLEKNLHVSQILVVTFTKLATKELRSRILEKLQEAKTAILTGKTGGDAVLDELLQILPNYPKALELITEAIRNFDECSIYTIHGYCQKLLTDYSIYTETLTDFSVQQGYEQHLLITENYWRTIHSELSQHESGRFLLSILLQGCTTPKDLLEKILPYLEKYSFSKIESDHSQILFPESSSSLYELKKRMIDLYQKDSASILEIFQEHTPARYIESRLRDLLPLVTRLFHHGSTKQRQKLRFFSALNEKHPFFGLVSEFEQEMEKIESIIALFYRSAAEQIQELYHNRIETSDSYHYQDLLQKASDAITKGQNRKKLLEILRTNYPVALVDEFQDTDPLQFGLFSAIYEGSSTLTHLCMIGDPKQAIYSFRGADVYTYLHAKNLVPEGNRYVLKRNYRSTASLIEGINLLIGKNSFSMQGLSYEPSAVGKTIPSLTLDHTALPAVQISQLVADQKLTKEKTETEIFEEVIRQIQELLYWIQNRQLRIGDRFAKASDIVVLLQSNKSIRTLQQSLLRAGIGAVSLTKESIYSTRESLLVLSIIRSFLNPTSTTAGILEAAGLIQTNRELGSDKNRSRIQMGGFFEEDLERWFREGFYSAFSSFMTRNNAWETVVQSSDGERTLSNLQQLAIEVQRAQSEGEFTPSHMANWLKQKMIHADSKREEEENDLETDDDRIRLMTLHKSKGLQFPIVFCPDLWKGSSSGYDKGGYVSYHAGNLDSILNISPKASATREQALKRAEQEKGLEQIRTAYVGLTRAEQHVRLFWSDTEKFDSSGLYGLIHGAVVGKTIQENPIPETDNPPKESPSVQTYLQNLSSRPDLFQTTTFWPKGVSENSYTSNRRLVFDSDDKTLHFSPSPYSGPTTLVKWNQYTDSFTSLHHRIQFDKPADLNTLFEPMLEVESTESAERYQTPFDLPRGPHFGSFYHRCTEDPRFQFSTFDPQNLSQLEWITELALKEGYDTDLVPTFAESLYQLSSVKLMGMPLKMIQPEQQIREMEFYLPFKNSDTSFLMQAIRGSTESSLLESLDGQLSGFLTGFIDLVVLREGKVWIVDYKTNYLGNQFEDYTKERLQNSITESLYDLQYTLYTVALKRYLETWLTGYDHQRDFMGVAYLYIRALKAGSEYGIWIDRPSDDVVSTLEQYWFQLEKEGGVR